MTDETGSTRILRPELALAGRLPILPRHPMLFLVAYWLTFFVGTSILAEPASIGQLGLPLARAILGTTFALFIGWAWQIAQYAGRIEALVNDVKRQSHVATAVALLAAGFLIVTLASMPPLSQLPARPTWMRVVSTMGSAAIFGLFVVTARRLVRAERALGLPTLGGFWTFALLLYGSLSAGFVSRRLMKVAGAANARGYQTRS